MTNPATLSRGVFLAIALMAAPMGLPGVPVVATAQAAQEHLVAAVLFEGNQGFSDGDLLNLVNVDEYGTYTEAGLASDAETIRQAYVAKGYVGVTVTPRVVVQDSGRAVITFVVVEGQRTGIAAINFTGNSAFSADTLKSVIRTHQTGLLSWLFRDDSYSEDQLTIDRQLIEYYYANHGYPDAAVTSAVGEFDASKNAYYVNFTISEGDRYKFGNIGVETSIPGLDATALTDVIRTHQGGRYSLLDLQATQEDMVAEATQQGFAFADVRPRVVRNIADNSFDITYLVDDGPRIYVERINITGNVKTRDAIIRRELEFGEGDPFNRTIIEHDKKAIEDLGFFKTVNITYQPGSSPDKVIVNVAVEEQPTGDYGLTAGYASDSGLLGELSVTERNFLGRGQYVKVSIGASQSGKTLDFSFTEPRFMGLQVSSGFDLYHRISDETPSNVYGVTSTGGQLRFGMPITRDISGTLMIGAEQKSIQDHLMLGDPPVLASESDLFNDGDTFNKQWLGYSLTYSTLDDSKHPTQGIIATVTQQYIHGDWSASATLPGSSDNLLRTEAKGRYYMPLLEDSGIVGSIEGQAGVVNALDGGQVSPLETFGYSSGLVRGFMSRGMGPRLDSSNEYLGYTMYAGASAEIEFPMPILPDTYGVRGALWADAAWIDGSGATPLGDGTDVAAGSLDENFKSSVGASIIWDSPFGPLRGDFAYVLSKATDDKTQVFQLTLQQLL
jgi:outer membrane protein insertion porin family